MSNFLKLKLIPSRPYSCRHENKKNKAFTLVETLVAISIFTVSILGMMSVLGSGISSTNYAKRKMIAIYLAQEGIEYVRNARDTEILYRSLGEDDDTEWNKFKEDDIGPCFNQECGFFSLPPEKLQNCNALNGCRLYLNNDNGRYEYRNGATSEVDFSGFTRTIWAEGVEDFKEIKVFSKVEWNQGSGLQSVTFSGNLFNWIEIAGGVHC